MSRGVKKNAPKTWDGQMRLQFEKNFWENQWLVPPTLDPASLKAAMFGAMMGTFEPATRQVVFVGGRRAGRSSGALTLHNHFSGRASRDVGGRLRAAAERLRRQVETIAMTEPDVHRAQSRVNELQTRIYMQMFGRSERGRTTVVTGRLSCSEPNLQTIAPPRPRTSIIDRPIDAGVSPEEILSAGMIDPDRD